MFFRLILIIEHDLSPLLQLIQTISATDTDEPLVGHKFIFSLSSSNPNFTIFDNEGKLCFTSSTFSITKEIIHPYTTFFTKCSLTV